MQPLSLNTIRSMFLDFFQEKDHLILPSFSLIPKNDPSILLINAGMTPMKNWFTGAATPPRKRVASCQKCIRTPDIENVGISDRHGTYFEMLGNFSFGDYFKREAITWAWEFITEWLEMPVERLLITVHCNDDEAYDIWHDEVGIPAERIRCFDKDNFWEHGTGPCGPCSEIFYDRGPEFACDDPNCDVGCDCDRYVEFWNLVFTEFNREEDGSYTPLKQKNIDTGAGLERIAVIMQGVKNLFEVDTVRAILDKVCEISGKEYGKDKKDDIAIRVISDHVRSAMMMIADGVLPGNEGRGYVLRRLIRRAVRYGRLLDIKDPFLSELTELAIAQSVDYYPELQDQDRILHVLAKEEERFGRTLQQGMQILNEEIDKARSEMKDILPGDIAFQLHDTFGFPLDLTDEIASERSLKVDRVRFKRLMDGQKERARRAAQEKVSTAWGTLQLPDQVKALGKTEFLGYDQLEAELDLAFILRTADDSNLLESVDEANEGDELIFVLKASPFYAEAGGQVGDQGVFAAVGTGESRAEVLDTEETADGIFLHKVRISAGSFSSGMKVLGSVDRSRRLSIARNHTATHLLHEALRRVLGDHVVQKGSYVSASRLRFDFQHDEPLTDEEKAKIEEIVNTAILDNYPVVTEVKKLEEARASGAMALFDERYDEEVRVITIGDFSCELCGGTHLSSTGVIGLFFISSEGGIASGVRRIEAVTGEAAHDAALLGRSVVRRLLNRLHVDQVSEIFSRLEEKDDQLARLNKILATQRQEEQQKIVTSLLDQKEKIGEFDYIFAELENFEAEAMRAAGDRMRDHLGDNAVVLIASKLAADKVVWLAMMGKTAIASGAKAGDLIKLAAAISGGKGGGRPDMAQGGGNDPQKITEAFTLARAKLQELAGK